MPFEARRSSARASFQSALAKLISMPQQTRLVEQHPALPRPRSLDSRESRPDNKPHFFYRLSVQTAAHQSQETYYLAGGWPKRTFCHLDSNLSTPSKSHRGYLLAPGTPSISPRPRLQRL